MTERRLRELPQWCYDITAKEFYYCGPCLPEEQTDQVATLKEFYSAPAMERVHRIKG